METLHGATKGHVTVRIPIPEPADNPPCFACGSKNPDGMHLQFYLEGDEVVTEFTAPSTWSGWGDILHGGFQSLLLDEVCSWAFSTVGSCRSFVTSELTVTFKRPVRVGQPLTIRGRIQERDDPRVLTTGEILDADGHVLTTGRATMRVLPTERFESIAHQTAGSGRFREV